MPQSRNSFDHLDVLRAQARELPELPGVYFWRDGRGRILYIGKAVNLRARVTSYFSTARHEARTRRLLSRARSITCEVTATELEALFRESALIKREQPEFNRALRIPRRGFWAKLDAANPNPYLESVREVVDDGSLYFGPFRSAAVLRETIAYLHHVLPLRKCTRAAPKCRPCMYYQMGTCAGPLIDAAHRQRHQDAIAHLQELLDGRSDRVITWLEAKRNRLCESLLFEQAAEVQQRIDTLHELIRRQTILDAAVRSRCVLIGHTQKDGTIRLLLVARGNVVAVRDAPRDVGTVLAWVRAHEPVMRAAVLPETELDVATVLERWLTVNREQARWVALTAESNDADLQERISFVMAAMPSAV